MTDWERFAQLEYIQMATEEDEDDSGDMDVFIESEPHAGGGTREAPFPRREPCRRRNVDTSRRHETVIIGRSNFSG